MHYECRSISFNKLENNMDGFVESLCTKCQCNDCSNPVEWKEVSDLGVKRKHRVLVRNSDPGLVVQCKGFLE